MLGVGVENVSAELSAAMSNDTRKRKKRRLVLAGDEFSVATFEVNGVAIVSSGLPCAVAGAAWNSHLIELEDGSASSTPFVEILKKRGISAALVTLGCRPASGMPLVATVARMTVVVASQVALAISSFVTVAPCVSLSSNLRINAGLRL